MITIDGLQWNVPCKIERTAEIQPSEISGMLLDKSYFNDVIGTFLVYNVSLAVPFGRETEYASIYEKLTEPVSGHTIVGPYGQGTITIVGRIDQVHDTYLRRKGGKNYWMEITFSLIANHPSKEADLEDAISMRGVPPLPPESVVNVGEVYEYSTNGWSEIGNAEDNYY